MRNQHATRSVLIIGLLAALPAFAKGKKQHVHEHGFGKLSIAVDGQTIQFDLDTPAQGIYGFEYEPKTDADKKKVAEANAKFEKSPADLFIFPADFGCQVKKSELKKEAEDGDEEKEPAPAKAGKGKAKKAKEKEVHSDLNGTVRFECAKPLAGAKITIALLKAFPLMKELKTQIITGTNQSAVSISKPEQEITL